MLVVCMVTSASALVLKKGNSGENVVALQQALNNNGYPVVVDGKFGAATEAAVISFQSKNNLKVDGKAGPATLTALGYVGPSSSTLPLTSSVLKVGATGSAVTQLQQALINLGYPVGTADGKYGSKTYKAVVLFQQLNGLKVDGKAGPLTQSKLYSGSAVAYSASGSAGVTGSLTKVTLSSSKPHVNDTLIAYIVPANANVTYVWYREDGTKVGTGSTYTVTMSDLNNKLYCVATGAAGSVSSLYTGVVTLTSEDASKVYLTGSVVLPSEIAVGATITPSIYLNPAVAKLYYAWYVGGVMTDSTATLKVTADMVGKEIRLVIKAQDETILGTLSSNVCTVRKQTSDSVQGGDGDASKVILPLKGTVTIPAEAQVGDTLTPTYSSDFNCTDTDKLIYTWYQNGTLIGSYKSLKVTEAMVGKDIHLVVTAAANTGFSGSIGTNYTHVKASVQGTNTLLTGKVVIATRTSVGSTVTADVTGLNSTKVDYKWYVNGTVVGTGASCKITDDMLGEYLTVTATAQDGSGYWGSVTSEKCFIAE